MIINNLKSFNLRKMANKSTEKDSDILTIKIGKKITSHKMVMDFICEGHLFNYKNIPKNKFKF